MFQNTYRLLTFIEVAEKIHGRKKLQKMIHLLKSAGTSFPFRYRYHHYGPYSSQLQSEMNQLVRQEYVAETHVNGAYHYEITGQGLEFKALMKNEGKYIFKLNEALLDNLMAKSVSYLEMFSTYVFLRESGDTDKQARAKATELKPHLADYLDNAVADYEKYIVH